MQSKIAFDHSFNKNQIIQAAAQAAKRGSRYMSSEDLIFLIRHDRAKVNRLRTYLSWKDVRKNAKDSGGLDATEEILEEPNAGALPILCTLVNPSQLPLTKKIISKGQENEG